MIDIMSSNHIISKFFYALELRRVVKLMLNKEDQEISKENKWNEIEKKYIKIIN